MLKRLLRHPRTQSGLAYLLGLYLAFAYRTTRWRLEGTEHIAQHVAGTPLIITFWHERLPLMSRLWELARAMPGHAQGPQAAHVLVSQHRDGVFIGAVIRRFHLDVVLGSSSRGGASGIRLLLGLLARGDFVAITPDGPRGPPRQAAAGVAHLAALSGAKILPCAAQTTRHRRLPTWDRMIFPVPFGRGVVVCGPPIAVPRHDWRAALPAITASLNAAAEQADRACGG